MTPRQRRIAEIIALVAVGGLLWWSANQTLIWAREQKPLEVTCADYVHTRPQAHWVRIAGCEPDYEHVTVEHEAGKDAAKHVYIPFRPQGSKAPAIVVLERHDPELLAFADAAAEELHHLAPIPVPTMAPTPEADAPPAIDPKVKQLADELQQPLQGVVGKLDAKLREDMLNMSLGIDSTFVLLEAGGRPSPLAGIAGLLFGVIAAGFLGFDLVRRRRPDEPGRTRDKRLSLNLG